MPDLTSAAVPEPRRILVRGVNWLGDAIMTTPALHRLRQRFPNSHIALFTYSKLADLWRGCPGLDAVLAFTPRESPLSVGRRLRSHAFDTALVLPNSPRSALEVWCAGIPQRIGYARPWRSWLLTLPVAPRHTQPQMRKRSSAEIKRLIHFGGSAMPPVQGLGSNTSRTHQLYEYLQLAAVLGADPEPLTPRLELEPAELETAKADLRSRVAQLAERVASPSHAIFLGMHASAAYGPAKRWPPERFAAVAREVSRRVADVVWLAFGDTRDWDLCAQIATQADAPFINLAGRTSLRDLMRFLAVSRVLLTNDSGPMHVAAALGTPVVALFGSTSPNLTGPGLPGDPRHRLLSSPPPCSPCFRRTCPIDFRCMTAITVDQVLTAVLDCLRQPLPGSL